MVTLFFYNESISKKIKKTIFLLRLPLILADNLMRAIKMPNNYIGVVNGPNSVKNQDIVLLFNLNGIHPIPSISKSRRYLL